MKRILLAVVALGTVGVLASGPASAAGICVDLDLSVNGQGQTLSQCLPPAE